MLILKCGQHKNRLIEIKEKITYNLIINFHSMCLCFILVYLLSMQSVAIFGCLMELLLIFSVLFLLKYRRLQKCLQSSLLIPRQIIVYVVQQNCILNHMKPFFFQFDLIYLRRLFCQHSNVHTFARDNEYFYISCIQNLRLSKDYRSVTS